MLGVTLLLLFTNLLIVYGEYDLLAFTLGQDQHLELNNATVITFNKEITNHKAASLASGVFTCKSAGLYKFQVYSLTRTDADLFLNLYYNSAVVASLWAHTPQDFASAGNAVILDLSVGDVVQVKSHTNQTVRMYGQPAELYTTFSGVQLGAYQSGSQLAGFSVALDQNQTVTPGAIVKYTKTTLDTDFAYNLQTGIFTSPNAGIYVVHLFGLAQQGKKLWLDLFHNSDYVCSIYGQTAGERADAGNTVILHLKPGDELQVRARPDTQNDLYGHFDQIFSTFTGYELFTEGFLMTNNHAPKSYFSMGLISTMTVSSRKKVIFDRVISDSGHFNHVTGEYVAPYFGTYEFNYHGLADQSDILYLDLYRNYKYVNSLYSHTSGDWGAAGNSAVLDLDKGDVVYVQANGDTSLFGEYDQVYCTFSGALLHSYSATAPPVGK